MPKRSTGIAAIILLTIFAASCSQTFRPIAIPEPPPGGDPQALRTAVVVSENPIGNGSASHISTSGDTNVGNATAGVSPQHAGFVGSLRAYIANVGSNTVTRYIPSSLITGEITIPMPAGCGPTRVFSRGTGMAYVACTASNEVAVMNVLADSIVAEVGVGAAPAALQGTLSGNKIYAMNSGDGTVTVINTVDNTVATTVAVGGSPVWADLNQDGTLLFVVNTAGYVTVINTSNDTVNTSIAVGAGPTFSSFDPNRRRLYVANTGGGTVSVIDAVSTSPTYLTVIATIAVGATPTSVVALPNGTKAYTANFGSNTVSVIDAASNTVIKTIATGTGPISLAAPTDSGRVIVGVRGSGTGTNFADPPGMLSIRTQDDVVVVNLKPAQQDLNCNPATAPNNYCALQQPKFVAMVP